MVVTNHHPLLYWFRHSAFKLGICLVPEETSLFRGHPSGSCYKSGSSSSTSTGAGGRIGRCCFVLFVRWVCYLGRSLHLIGRSSLGRRGRKQHMACFAPGLSALPCRKWMTCCFKNRSWKLRSQHGCASLGIRVLPACPFAVDRRTATEVVGVHRSQKYIGREKGIFSCVAIGVCARGRQVMLKICGAN